jgi:murein L,D-transpeptidase YcbB/YkuD
MRLIFFLILLINLNSYAENPPTTSPSTPEKPVVPAKPVKPAKPVPPPYIAPDSEWALRLEKGKVLIHKDIRLENLPQLRDLYIKQNYQLVWYQNQRLIPEAKTLVESTKTAKNEGLEPNDYFVTFLENCFNQVSKCEEKDVDVLLSESFINYTTHLRQGRFKPRTVDGDWFMKPSTWNAVEVLLETLKNGKMKEVLEDSPPKHSQYVKFREMFNNMLAKKKGNAEAEIPRGHLRIGMQSPAVKILRQRLLKSGDLSTDNNSDEFDEELKEAVKTFQKRNHLKADGLMGEQTRQLLNQGLSFSQATFRHIQATLERWRWMPRELGDNYIMVNLPSYRLDVIENEKSVLNMKVVVGRPDRRSPTLNDKITQVIINPSWFVPPSLMSEHMRERGFKVSKVGEGIRMRQPPGDNNALGRIKFSLTNGHNIYLHDTPKKHLFGNPARAYSSGCIRLEEPFDLLMYLIKDENKVEKIADYLDTDTKTRYYPLATPVPVYLTYQTLWFDQNGELQKLKDIYDVDEDLMDTFISIDPNPSATEVKKKSEDD